MDFRLSLFALSIPNKCDNEYANWPKSPATGATVLPFLRPSKNFIAD
jgi:hypothetical protein